MFGKPESHKKYHVRLIPHTQPKAGQSGLNAKLDKICQSQPYKKMAFSLLSISMRIWSLNPRLKLVPSLVAKFQKAVSFLVRLTQKVAKVIKNRNYNCY